ncbi:GH39 family glycosyl hydrolase [Phytoactinopolyspora halotolerans]|uniref:Glycoside hydrolase n=1 Tax=Phytoactinopolyspora halotolerans TaxID=1981512 RepID=A0A6L9SAF3_9ACTN|nr:glycoside hydrolase [Phytoactinopolyspora halotolerans]NEE01552.1 glycoside hydrolase [Phytoactinopolyspora halotolerans]
MTEHSTARADWEERIGRPSDLRLDTGSLPPPSGLTAVSGTGHVRLAWHHVDGALGYLVYRADSPTGPFEPLDHRGGDVLAVPRPPYADTLLEPGRRYWYKVASWSDGGAGELSPETVDGVATAPGDSTPTTHVIVDAVADPQPLPDVWRRMIGAEHLSLLTWDGDGPGGTDVAAEYAAALRLMRDEIGVRSVRAHGTFLPECVTVRDDGRFDFSGLDEVYDRLLGIGLTPVVELSFMPAELAADPSYTVFGYQGIASVPRDWERWGDLCRDLTIHLRDRYGADEVAGWEFEVWNEANLEVFWNGTQSDYHRLYEVAARAVKSVDPRIRVGGPGSAAAGWVGPLLEHCREHDVPIDFVSTHTYGNAPLDFRPLARSFAEKTGRKEPEILWTEWGVTPTHFHRVSDSVFAAPFVLHGMKSALETTDCLAYWVATDHFEELGWPQRLFHGGFGLLTVGNLRKPRFWALLLLSELRGGRIPATATGDGAEALVEALATRTPEHTAVDVLVWNGTLDQTKIDGAAALNRTVTVTVNGLAPGATYEATSYRVDQTHGNIQAVWDDLGGGAWPDERQWEKLHAADELPPEQLDDLTVGATGTASVTFALPMPGIRAIRLTRR